MTGGEVSLGSGAGGLMYYLQEKEPERVDFVETHNLPSKNSKLIANQMNKTAADSARCKNPFYHTSLNWHPDDNPTHKQMRDIGQAYIEHMGLEDYQSVIVAHNDTAHSHIHIAVNRIHPETGKAWDLNTYIGEGRDRKFDQMHNERVQKFNQVMEHEYGWVKVKGKHRVGKQKDKDIASSPTRSEYNQAKKRDERLKGLGMDPDEYDTRSVRLRAMDLKDELFRAESFKEIDQVLAKKGLWIQAEGQGAVFTDGIEAEKASDIQRHLSGPRLEDKFGEQLKVYVSEREKDVSAALGYRELADWTRGLEVDQMRQAVKLLEDEKRQAKGKLGRLGRMERKYNAMIESLPKRFNQAYINGSEAYQEFGRYLGDEKVSEEKALSMLGEDPGRFGVVGDRDKIDEIQKQFRQALSARDKIQAFVHGIEGKGIDGRKETLLTNAEKAEKQIEQLNKKIVEQLKSDLYDERYDPIADEANRSMKRGFNKALSIHRALNKAVGKAGSDKSKELSKLLSNIGILIRNPTRGSAKITKQVIKLSGQNIVSKKRDRGLGL